MSIELRVKLERATVLAALLADVDRTMSGVPHGRVAIVGGRLDAAAITLGPTRLEKPVWIETGRIARIGLFVVCHSHGPGRTDVAEDGDAQVDDKQSWWVLVDAAIRRTRASFCLAALLARSIAASNNSSIQDDALLLRRGEWVTPEELAELFAASGDTPSFEAFSDRFCDLVNFAPTWPRAVDVLAQLERSST